MRLVTMRPVVVLLCVAFLDVAERARGALSLVNNVRGSMEWSNSTKITSDLLQYSSNVGSNSDIMYQLVDVFPGSTLLLTGIALGSQGGAFYQGDIDANRVSITQDGSDTTVAGFTFTASHVGSLIGQTSWVADVALAPAPVAGANLRPAVTWAGLITMTPELLSYSASGADPDAIKYYIIFIKPKTLVILNSTQSVTVESGINVFTQADINAGILQVGHTGTTSDEVGFDFVPVHGNSRGQLSTFLAAVLPAAMPGFSAQDEPETVKWSSGITIGQELLRYQAGPATDDDLTYTVTSVYNGTIMVVNGTQLTASNSSNATLSESFLQSAITLRLISLAHDGRITDTLGFSYTVRYGDTETEQQQFAVLLEMAPVPSLVANLQSTVSHNTSAVLSWLNLYHLVEGVSSSLIKYRVTSILPGTSLAVNGTEVAPDSGNTTVSGFTQGEIDDGAVQIGHDGGNDTVAGFDFVVSYGPSLTQPDSFRANVTINTPTQVYNLKSGVFWMGTSAITNQQLKFAAPAASADELVYTVSMLWDGTILRRGNVMILAGITGRDSFTQQDIDSGFMSISHGGTGSVGEIGFFFVVEGPAGTKSQPSTFAAVVGVSVPEAVANVQTNIAWKGSHTPSKDVLEFQAEGALPSDIIYTITHLFEGTIFQLNGLTRGLSRITFTQKDVDNGEVNLIHNGKFTDLIGFNFTAAYGNAVTPVKMYLLLVATAPSPANVSNVPLSLPWKGSATVTASDLSYESSELEATSSDILYTVTMLQGGSLLRRNGLPIGPGLEFFSFTQKDIELDIMTLAHDGTVLSGEAGFEFRVTYGNRCGASPASPQPQRSAVMACQAYVIPADDICCPLPLSSEPEVANFTASVAPPEGPTVRIAEIEPVNWDHFVKVWPENLYSASEGAAPSDIMYHVRRLIPGSSVVVSGVAVNVTGQTNLTATGYSFTQLDINEDRVALHHVDSVNVTQVGFLFTVSYVGTASPEMAFEAELVSAPVPFRVKNLGLQERVPWGGEAVVQTQVLQFALAGYDGSDIVYSVLSTRPATALRLNGTAGHAEFTQADINAGLISLGHNSTLVPLDSSVGFTFSVRLSGGNTESDPEDFTAAVAQASAPAEVSNSGQDMDWKGQLVLTSEMLAYASQDTEQEQLPVLVLYTVTGLMDGSRLSLDGTDVVAGAAPSGSTRSPAFSQADISRGGVLLQHSPEIGSVVATVGFTFVVTFGNSQPTAEKTFTAAVGSAPAPEAIATASAAELRVSTGGQVGLSAVELEFSATGAEPAELVYSLVEIYASTSLYLDGVAAELGPGSAFSQEHINQGLLTIRHTTNITGDLLGFLYVVHYGGTASPVETLEAQTIGGNQDDPQPPVAQTNQQGTVGWRGSLVVSRELLEYGPAVGSALPGDIDFQVISLEEGGELELGGSPMTPGSMFTQASINADLLVLSHDGSNGGKVGFSFVVTHNGAVTYTEESFAAEIVGPVPPGQQALTVVAKMTLLDLSLEEFTDALEKEFITSIAIAALVPDSQVAISSKESGSVVLTMEVAFPTGSNGQQLAHTFKTKVSYDPSGVLNADFFGAVDVEIEDETKVTTFGETIEDSGDDSSAIGHDRTLTRLFLLATAAVAALVLEIVLQQ